MRSPRLTSEPASRVQRAGSVSIELQPKRELFKRDLNLIREAQRREEEFRREFDKLYNAYALSFAKITKFVYVGEFPLFFAALRLVSLASSEISVILQSVFSSASAMSYTTEYPPVVVACLLRRTQVLHVFESYITHLQRMQLHCRRLQTQTPRAARILESVADSLSSAKDTLGRLFRLPESHLATFASFAQALVMQPLGDCHPDDEARRELASVLEELINRNRRREAMAVQSFETVDVVYSSPMRERRSIEDNNYSNNNNSNINNINNNNYYDNNNNNNSAAVTDGGSSSEAVPSSTFVHVVHASDVKLAFRDVSEKHIDFDAIARAMLVATPEGVMRKTKGLKSVNTPSHMSEPATSWCFTGFEAVQFMRYQLSTDALVCVTVGQELLLRDYFEPVASSPYLPFTNDGKVFRALGERRGLNCDTPWCGQEIRGALTVVCELLQRIMDIYQKFEGIITRYGPIGLSIAALTIEYRSFHAATSELQHVSLEHCTTKDRLCFFVNLFNLLSLHSFIHQNIVEGGFNLRDDTADSTMLFGERTWPAVLAFQSKYWYRICGRERVNMSIIESSILRPLNSDTNEFFGPAILKRLLKARSRRTIIDHGHPLALRMHDPRIVFLLNRTTRSCPPVCIVQPSNLETVINGNALHLMRRFTRVFSQGGKMKVQLPPTLGQCLRDFGDSDADTVLYLRQWMQPYDCNSVDLFFQSSSPSGVVIDPTDFQGAFMFPLPSSQQQGAEEFDDGSAQKSVLSKTHVFPVSSGAYRFSIQVRDTLFESPYAFSTAYHWISCILQTRERRLRAISLRNHHSDALSSSSSSSSTAYDRKSSMPLDATRSLFQSRTTSLSVRPTTSRSASTDLHSPSMPIFDQMHATPPGLLSTSLTGSPSPLLLMGEAPPPPPSALLSNSAPSSPDPFASLERCASPPRPSTRSAGLFSDDKHLLRQQELFRAHVQQLQNVVGIFRDYRSEYQGLSFRPSTFKKDPVLQFIPINLHMQVMEATCVGLESLPDRNAQRMVFDHVTFGAPAAHLLGFKNIGLRQLLQTLREGKLDAETREAQVLHVLERLDVVLPQALAALISSFALKVRNRWRDPEFWLQIANVGFLMHFESLLSTYKSELGMLSDADVAISSLDSFSFVLVPTTSKIPDFDLPTLEFIRQTDDDDAVVGQDMAGSVFEPASTADEEGRKTRVPRPQAGSTNRHGQLQGSYTIGIGLSEKLFEQLPVMLKEGGRVRVFPVLFTQGINEQQSLAIRFNETRLQEDINNENIDRLSNYFFDYQRFREYRDRSQLPIDTLPAGFRFDADLPSVSALQKELVAITAIIRSSHREKNTEILPKTADWTRRLSAGRATSCKSAKDRTSMSITWEQARLLNYFQRLPNSEITNVTNQLRSEGVRKENAFRNIGKSKFAFNPLQLRAIPEVYRAPATAISSGQS